MKLLRFILNLISLGLIAIAIVILLGLHQKLPGGIQIYSIVSGSMEPAIPVGSVSIVQPLKTQTLVAGDVITFHQPGETNRLITHRVAEVKQSPIGTFYRTKGDANSIADPWEISYGQIKGIQKYSYPYLGTFIEFLRTPLGIGLFVVLPILVLAITELRNIVNIMVESRLKNLLDKQKKHIQLGVILFLLLTTVHQSYAVYISNTVTIGPNSLTTAVQFPDRLLINEIYFFPDSTHGGDCNTAGSSSIIINQSNTDTGSGSTNTNTANVNNSSTTTENNIGTINETIGGAANTGNNNTNGNGTVGNVNSGNIGLNISTNNSVNTGSSVTSCDEWIELYNPNTSDVALDDWSIVDSSGTSRTLTTAQAIAPNSFALIVKNAATFSSFWTVPPGIPIIALGQEVGNGLGNVGDNLILKNPAAAESDSISWGTDPTLPHYAGPLTQGQSLSRVPSGADTNSGTDFVSQTPTPGNL